MKNFTLPGTDVVAPNVVLGLMRIEDKSDDEIRELTRTARDEGINFFDHADIYGSGVHTCEQRWGDAMQLTPSEREQVTIQTKAGIVKDGPHYNFSYDHIVSTVEGSLKALRTEYIDILLLHRYDALTEPDEVARALEHLHSTGKVRHFGVSNHTPGQIELLKKSVTRPLVVNQLQLAIGHAAIVAQGMAMNIEGQQEAYDLSAGGILDYCRLHDITIQAWSPMQTRVPHRHVFLGSEHHPELNALIDELAAKYDVEPEAVATGWITRHPANMQVVLGTTTPARVAASAQGSELPLTRPEWYGLLQKAGYIIP